MNSGEEVTPEAIVNILHPQKEEEKKVLCCSKRASLSSVVEKHFRAYLEEASAVPAGDLQICCQP